ncbi:hypothetical protein C9994_11475 [Marivirga lumbricoides]|uniref:histidine kinase n=1 Tax=Marivirga lumbricoides TaxID=1046115 RepID=A0A2T4DN91_9BACT|nr:hypothetical protein C9994_11475 [Marivirga lumbricoides]
MSLVKRGIYKVIMWEKFFFSLFLSVVLIASFNTGGYSQTRNTRFQHLTIDDGLPQNMVDCMLQDSHGFLWFGTWNGLCRYDGYTFEVFDNQSSKGKSIRDNFIYALLEDAYGNIWIGTHRGLQVYLHQNGEFIFIDDERAKGADLKDKNIRSLALTTNGNLVVGSNDDVYLFEIANSRGELNLTKNYTLGIYDKNIRGTVVNTLTTDAVDDIWIGTNAGITVIPSNDNDFKYFNTSSSGLSSDQVLSIFESGNGEIWIGTEYGLNKLNQPTNSFIQFVSDGNIGLVHNTIMDIIEDNSGNLLIATLGGLSVMDKQTNQFTNYKNEYNVKHSLSNDFVNCLLLDDKNNVWIGTERGGVNFYNTNQNVVEHFEYHPDNSNSLSYSTVNSVFKEEGILWIGTAGGGVNKYNPETGVFTHYRNNPEDPASISSDFITTISKDKYDRLWIGTWGWGLNILSKTDKVSDRFIRHAAPEKAGLTSNFISSVVADAYGNLWIGTLGGLVKYDIEKDEYQPYNPSDNTIEISNIGCLLFENKNTLWLGTRNGLYRLQSADGTFEPKNTIIDVFTSSGNDTTSISGNYVISMLKDSEGGLWFGTYGQGLNKLIKKGNSIHFKSFTTKDGLSNTVIYGIEQDNEKNIWLSTDFGLSRLDPETEDFRNFYTVDGLLNNQYYWSATHKSEDGKLYFGGMEGLDAFYPEWIKDDFESSKVTITDIKILNESVAQDKEYNGVVVLEESSHTAEKINISYKEKVFGIEFSSLNFRQPKMVRYAYILEGFENEWNYVSSGRRYATYTNLKPGEYTFKVKASGSNGEFDTSPTSIVISIAPPFWDTLWFKFLCGLMLVGIILGYIRYRTYSLNKQKVILEAQVKERTEKISLQKEALSLQALQLLNNNNELEEKQEMIEGQNLILENQNKEITNQHNELKKLNNKLKLVSQLKLSFFTNISHEFRTPLTLILGPIEYLLKQHDLSKEVKNSLNVMNRNAQRLLHLVNQIMDFRKIEQKRMELKVAQGSISGFCKNIFKAFEPLSTARNINFSYQEFSLPEEVWFDKGNMENVLYNILSNAFKYTNPGGNVNLEVKGLTKEEANIKLDVEAGDQEKSVISIKVQDTGVGISKENLPLVFKRFYRIESEEAFKIGGSGIGLALTEELVKAHHGNIFVQSVPGEGSTFEIQFPCLKNYYSFNELSEKLDDEVNITQQVEILKNEFLNDYSEEESMPEVSSVFERTRATILIVEDNTDLRKFIAHRFDKTYEVIEAPNGSVGIDLAFKHWPDLVISDVMMPEIGGLELCATLKNNLATSHIPIILLTAKSEVENQIEGLQTGADEYLAKPFNFELLEARVINLIESRKELRKKFLEVSDFRINDATTNPKDEKFLKHAIKIVEENMEESLFGVKQFVDTMGISRSLLHKKLKKLTDQSAAEFINHLRMKRAKQLLKEGELNVSEVAYAVGYNDPKYFTRLFNKYFGKSPKDFMIK